MQGWPEGGKKSIVLTVNETSFFMANAGKGGGFRGTAVGTVSINFLWFCLIADPSRVWECNGVSLDQEGELGKPSWLAETISSCLVPSAQPLEAHGAHTRQEPDPGNINYIPESKSVLEA